MKLVLKRFYLCICALSGLFFSVEGKITIGKIVDTGSTLTCDMTVGWFEGTGTHLNAIFTFTTMLILTDCLTGGELISLGTASFDGTSSAKVTIYGSQNTFLDSTIGIMTVKPLVQGELDRRTVTARGITTISAFTVQTYVTLIVEGNNVMINGQSIPAGTYELAPGQVFP